MTNSAVLTGQAILVIDDDPMVGRAIRRILSREHHVVVVTSGEQALRRVEAGEHFDAILCDLMMPEMSGPDVYAALQGLGSALADRLIFMTGGACTEQARRLLGSAPHAPLEKPFSSETLRALFAAGGT